MHVRAARPRSAKPNRHCASASRLCRIILHSSPDGLFSVTSYCGPRRLPGNMGDRYRDGSGRLLRAIASRSFHEAEGATLRRRAFNGEGAGGCIFFSNGLGVLAAWRVPPRLHLLLAVELQQHDARCRWRSLQGNRFPPRTIYLPPPSWISLMASGRNSLVYPSLSVTLTSMIA